MKENRLLDDLTRVATGAVSALGGVREEVEARVREHFERAIAHMDLVTREEFDAVQIMASRARSDHESLLQRLAALEARLAVLEGDGGPTPKGADLEGKPLPPTSATANPSPSSESDPA